MSTTGRLRSLYLSYLSLPAPDRLVYRAVLRLQARRILEVGIGFAERAVRMIEAAGRHYARGDIRYTGIDLFESRTSADGPGVSLKMAHRLLNSTGAKVLLVPGDPLSALARAANAIGQVDVMVVSSRLGRSSLAASWYYVPRLLHPETAVFVEESVAGGRPSVRPVDHAEIQAWAGDTQRRRAA